MKRGGALKRTTELRRGAPMRRTGFSPAPADKSAPPRKTPRDTGPPRSMRLACLIRDGYCCVCCGQSIIGQSYSIQHRKRRSQGGRNVLSNLITLQGTGTTGHHHRIDSRIDPADELNGYTVRSTKDPASVPLLLVTEHTRRWVLATDDGDYIDTDAPEGIAA